MFKMLGIAGKKGLVHVLSTCIDGGNLVVGT